MVEIEKDEFKYYVLNFEQIDFHDQVEKETFGMELQNSSTDICLIYPT